MQFLQQVVVGDDRRHEGSDGHVEGTGLVGNLSGMQQFLHHQAPRCTTGFVLTSGSMLSVASEVSEIRKNLMETALADCIVSLPSQLFRSTQIPSQSGF